MELKFDSAYRGTCIGCETELWEGAGTPDNACLLYIPFANPIAGRDGLPAIAGVREYRCPPCAKAARDADPSIVNC